MNKTYKWLDYRLFLTKWYKEQLKKSKNTLYFSKSFINQQVVNNTTNDNKINMEITLKREAFSSTLQNINSVVDKSTTKPILSNFVIRTIEGNNADVEFSSTDYELSLVELVPAEIKEQGSICVNAKKVFDISSQKSFGSIPFFSAVL